MSFQVKKWELFEWEKLQIQIIHRLFYLDLIMNCSKKLMLYTSNYRLVRILFIIPIKKNPIPKTNKI